MKLSIPSALRVLLGRAARLVPGERVQWALRTASLLAWIDCAALRALVRYRPVIAERAS